METKAVKPIRDKSRKGSVTVASALLALLALGVAGCAENRGIRFIPVGSQNVLALSSDDIVQVMRGAGFSDRQILEYGTDLRNGLARSGAIEVRINNVVEVTFAIKGDYVYINTRLRGNFIYNASTGGWVSSDSSGR